MTQTNQTTGNTTQRQAQDLLFKQTAKKSYREFTELRDGAGTTKSYDYWYNGIRLRTKEDVAQALRFKWKVMRKDKILGTISQYDFKIQRFERVN